MKVAVVFLAVVVYGTNALSVPVLSWFNSTTHKAINATHFVNGQAIELVDSTNQAAADYVKDVSQTNTLWLQDGMDKLDDKTKDAIQIAQDKTNQLLNIIGQFGGPLKWGAAIGSKVTNFTASAGQTMTNVGVGTAQLSTAMANQALGAAVDTMAKVSSGVAGKATAANDIAAHVASAGVNEVVKVASDIGMGVGNAMQAVGKGVSNLFSVPSRIKNSVHVPTAEANAGVDAGINVTA